MVQVPGDPGGLDRIRAEVDMPKIKVRVLSGSQQGAVLDIDRIEAECGLASGFYGLEEATAPVADELFVIDDEPKPKRHARRVERDLEE